MFRQSFSCSVLLDFTSKILSRVRGYHPLWPHFPERSAKINVEAKGYPRSLATTKGISVDFFSSGYLDVSVPLVRLLHLMDSSTRYLGYS